MKRIVTRIWNTNKVTLQGGAVAALAVALVIFGLSCGGPREYSRISAESGPKGKPAVEVIPGDHWIHTFRVMLVAKVENEWATPEDLEPGAYVVKAEINQSRDFNEAYGEDLEEEDPNYSGGSWGSGQPSLIWQGLIGIGDGPESVDLSIVGRGHPVGDSGDIYRDLDDITTALSVVESIGVRFIAP